MIMQWATGRGGRYRYFFCLRKQQHLCEGRYVQGDAVEDAVVEFYGTLRFPTDMADDLRQVMHETLDEEERTCKLVHQQLTAQLARLDTQEENLLDLVANGGESSSKIKQRLNVIQRERSQVAQQLEQTGERLAIGAALIEDALKLLHDPQGLYEQMAPEQRRLMNQAIYAKLYVYEDAGIDAVLNPPFDELLEAKQALTRAKSDGLRATNNQPGTLAGVLLAGGSNKRVMVEVTGLEPATSTMRT